MKSAPAASLHLTSIAEQHQLLALPTPAHPLVSLLRFEDFPRLPNTGTVRLTLDFYTITLKRHCACKVRYGQTPYDFNEGVMSFIAPKQVLTQEGDLVPPASGWLLAFHPDFIRTYPLGQKILAYGFFQYALSEALLLSAPEEAALEALLQRMAHDYHLPIDKFSQDVLVAQLELLLTYCHRYYERQFSMRKAPSSALLIQLETLLTDYFAGDNLAEVGPPSVAYLAQQLHLSPKYLSDLLRHLTGQSAQQHIHDKLLEKAKTLLTTTTFSVSEIAFQLGFGYSQSFSKLFKNKTTISPLEFRQSFTQ